MEEYHIDPDIHTFGVTEESKLVDSKGQEFSFRKIECDVWVPDQKIGTLNHEELKARLVSLPVLSEYEARIRDIKDIPGLIEVANGGRVIGLSIGS